MNTSNNEPMITFRVHWIRVTLSISEEAALELWRSNLESSLGPLRVSGHGGLGFERMYEGLCSSKLYVEPKQAKRGAKTYVSLELPGTACDAIAPEIIHNLFVSVSPNQLSFTRLDLAWDNVGFTPLTMRNAIENNQIRTKLQRRTLGIHRKPLENNEAGKLGTTTVYLGSRQSMRMFRAYDLHGPVRFELELKNRQADLAGKDILPKEPATWATRAMPFVRACIDFQDNGDLLPWWKNFVGNSARLGIKLVDAPKLARHELEADLYRSVSPRLSIWVDVSPEGSLEKLLEYGRKTRGDRYDYLF